MPSKKIFLIVALTFFSFFLINSPLSAEAASKLPKGSQIAGISVEGKTIAQVTSMLENEEVIWKSGSDIVLASDYEQTKLPREAIEFEIDQTIEQYIEKTKRSFSTFFLRKKNVQMPLIVHVNEEHEAIQSLKGAEHVDVDATIQLVEELAKNLQEGDVSIQYVEGEKIPLETISEVEMEIPELSDTLLTQALKPLEGHVITPEDRFSFIETIVQPEELTQSTAEFDFLASALYKLFLQTNFQVVERHTNTSVAESITPGLDVAIRVDENKDLILLNSNSVIFELDVEKTDGKLKLSLKSAPTEYTYKYETVNKKELQPRTVYRYSDELRAGEEQIIQAGQDGLKVEVHRAIYEDDVYIDSKFISEDVYLPVPKIVLVSTSEEDSAETEAETEAEAEGDKVTELEETIDDLEEQLEGTNEIISQYPTVSEGPTYIEQIEIMKELQERLEKKLAEMKKEVDEENEGSAEEVEQLRLEMEEKFEAMNQQLEKLLEHLTKEKNIN